MRLSGITALTSSKYQLQVARNVRKFCYNATKWSQPEGYKTCISIYNPITKTKVPFVTKSSEYISWYICGPTVYDSTHIGHAITYIRLDIIRRILEKYTKASIWQVMCVTDIDNKIINKANEQNIDYKILARSYENEFFADLADLNIKKPTVVSRVTDFIPQMIKFIQSLLQKNTAYVSSDGSVYFSVGNYGKHGKFRQTHLLNENKLNDNLLSKENVFDFALWKSSKPNEPSWQSPWGPGRPGWHIECSTIASEYFGNCIDLHSGGIDLVFPHHENEESQSCAFHNIDQWVNYWLHTGHLHYKNDKMSKSLKNTISVREYLSTNSGNHLRMLCLFTYYRSQIDFDGDEIATTVKMCTRFFQFFDECRAYLQGYTDKGNIDSCHLQKILQDTKNTVDKHIVNDFDTRSCMLTLLDLMSATSSMLTAPAGNRSVTSVSLVYLYIESITNLFGLDFSGKSTSGVEVERSAESVDGLINTSVNFRSDVRNTALSIEDSQNNEVKKQLLYSCDQFRKEFNKYGVAIKDRKNDSTTWSYVVTSSTSRKTCKTKMLKNKERTESKETSSEKLIQVKGNDQNIEH